MSDATRPRYGLCDVSCGWGGAHKYATTAPTTPPAAQHGAAGTPGHPGDTESAQGDSRRNEEKP